MKKTAQIDFDLLANVTDSIKVLQRKLQEETLILRIVY